MLVGGGPSQLWDCKICQKSLKGRAGEVARHYLRTHQVEPILPCHVCDYTSRTEKMYQAHRMVLSINNLFLYSFNKYFFSNTDLSRVIW